MTGPRGRGRPDALRVRAAAKVNLVLRVGPRRADGYHDLLTLMVPVGLADVVDVRVAHGRRGAVTCRVPGRRELDGPSNLAARAAEAFRRRLGLRDRIAITIDKRIPVTAGLGGGSSDAAAVLRALARAYRVRDRGALAQLALGIGSDVPFFLGRGAAWATGRGERLAPVRVPTLWLVLLHPRDPALAIRAGDAYAWLDASRHRSGVTPRLPNVPYGSAWRPSHARNDLQIPCFERHPRLGELRAHLVGRGATAAIMSGSGPTVFGVFATGTSARRAAGEVSRAFRDVDVHVVRSVHRHPGVTPWKSPRSASSRSTRRSSRRT
jgi:4-diphosphocytidyl-2-C-methyl-D-erythritol kinase